MGGTKRTVESEEHHYVCGQCSNLQYATISNEPPVPCVDCGWVHREQKKFDLPSQIKMDLTKY